MLLKQNIVRRRDKRHTITNTYYYVAQYC